MLCVTWLLTHIVVVPHQHTTQHTTPGGPWFNLFNLGGKSEAEMKKLKLNEIKNGRLAMLAVFGYGAQVRYVRADELASLVAGTGVSSCTCDDLLVL